MNSRWCPTPAAGGFSRDIRRSGICSFSPCVDGWPDCLDVKLASHRYPRSAKVETANHPHFRGRRLVIVKSLEKPTNSAFYPSGRLGYEGTTDNWVRYQS